MLRGTPTDRDIDVHPFTACRLDIRRHTERNENIAHDERRFSHALERRIERIQIEVQIIGTVGIVARRVPGIEVDAAEVNDPQ